MLNYSCMFPSAVWTASVFLCLLTTSISCQQLLTFFWITVFLVFHVLLHCLFQEIWVWGSYSSINAILRVTPLLVITHAAAASEYDATPIVDFTIGASECKWAITKARLFSNGFQNHACFLKTSSYPAASFRSMKVRRLWWHPMLCVRSFARNWWIWWIAK